MARIKDVVAKLKIQTAAKNAWEMAALLSSA